MSSQRNSMPSVSRDADTPPLYHAATMPLCSNSLPLYSESPGHSELRVLHSTPSTTALPTRARTRQCVQRTDHMSIDVGEFPYVVMCPAYGFNGVVEGVMTIRKKCTFVSQITATLQGSVSTSAADHAKVAIPGLSKVSLFDRTITLFSAPQVQDAQALQSVAADTQYRFSIPFPTYIDGRSTVLPPSHTAIHPGVALEVAYTLQLSITRKGFFRRNEVCTIPVLYLPKTRPPLPTLLELPPVSADGELYDRVKAIALTPTWPSTCQARELSQGAALPSVQAFLPLPRCYPSGEPIPIALKISSPASPALTKLYFPNIEVQLVRRRRLYVGTQKQYSLRENVVGTAVIDRTTCPSFGECCLIMRLEAGAMGKECSWSVENIVDVLYIIRFCVRPPKDTPHLPLFRHEEVVQLTSDPYESLETEMLTGNISAPAYGLTSLRPGPEFIYQTRP
ncbi:hypothetical protein PsYK624_030450 [Phanerochaete sordida]|uniref:Arrestin-like N-terminal domain-containing protein n=1 Tax=Phanerochaete sordida TaxID=48140 RepID=A0A9P3G0X0_9APHY|nr:hypothetical protein PsYK624_030450 [Phanerochaete sordida]